MGIGTVLSIVEAGVEALLAVDVPAAQLTAMAAMRAMCQRTQTQAPAVVARRAVWAFVAQAATASMQMGQRVLSVSQGNTP